MNVCLLTHTFPKSPNDSIAAFLHALVVGMEEVGIQTSVMTPYHKSLRAANFPYKMIVYKYIWPANFHRLGYSSTLTKGGELPPSAYLLVPFLFIAGLFRLVRVLKREDIDIICAHWLFPSGLIAAVASTISGIPFTVTLPGSDVYVAGLNQIFRSLAKFVTNRAGAVIADSPAFIDKVKKLGATLNYTKIIPYPVNIDVYKPSPTGVKLLKKKFGFRKRSVIILAVGRMIEKKGFIYLLSAMKDIVQADSRVRLVLVGDGDLRNELEDYAAMLKMNKYVVFAGNVDRDELKTFYNMADLFVMTSIVDSHGNIDDQPVALLEAMSSGLPVVATDFPGISLSVRNGVNGILVPQKDVMAIKEAIIKLALSKNLRVKMGKASRSIALSKFSTRKIALEYKRVFHHLLYEQ